MDHDLDAPSLWVRRWAALISDVAGGAVLDLACGRGRHARHLAALGYAVTAVDRDAGALASLEGVRGVHTLCADLEAGPWPLAQRRFAGIVVTHYLHRPLFPRLLEALDAGGVLIYETFARGNEHYGRPSNPDYLLRPGELLEAFGSLLTVVGFEQGRVTAPKQAVVQRLCAVRALAAGDVALDTPASG